MEHEGEGTRPAPLPLPLAPPQRRLTRAQLVAVVSATVVLLVASVFACVQLAGRGLPLLLSFVGSPRHYSGAWWADDGGYGVVQSADANGRPYVLVWEKRTGRTRRITGRRVIAVEPQSAQVWLMPDTGEGTDDGFEDESWDPAPRVLLRWVLDDGSTPERVTTMTVRWNEWHGPGDRSAVPIVDRTRGGWPTYIAFSSRQGTETKTPDLDGTLAPIGWSPSGRYFAAYVLRRPLSEAEGRGLGEEEPGVLGDWGSAGESRRVVFDASTGEIAAEEQVSSATFASGEPWGAWDASRDVLYYPCIRELGRSAEGPPEETLMSVAALDATTGKSRDAFDLNRWRRPEAFENTDQVLTLGGGGNGPVFLTGTPEAQTWRLTPSGPKRLPVDPESGRPAAWSEKGGMLCYTWGASDQTADRPVVLREDGTVEAKIDAGDAR